MTNEGEKVVNDNQLREFLEKRKKKEHFLKVWRGRKVTQRILEATAGLWIVGGWVSSLTWNMGM